MMRFVRTLWRRLREFRADARGNTMILFGFALIPMVGITGAALDYSRAVTLRSELNAIADSAALQAVSMTSIAALPNTPDNGKASAESFFRGEARTLKEQFTLDNVTVTVKKSVTDITATVSYTATSPNYFMPVLGLQTTAVHGSATSTTALPVYMDFYLLLDNSPSMGLGATQADIDTMVANTPASKYGSANANCAFACHQADKPGKDFYALAKKLGVTMRIDVVRQATQQLMDNAAATEVFTDQFRMAIYTFSDSLVKISDLTANLSQAKATANAIDIKLIPSAGYNNDQYTDLDTVLPQINTAIPAPGTGYSSATPQKWLFFVSDGVADESLGGTRRIKPVTLSQCTDIKNRGVQIAVLYTTYYPLPTNAFYNSYVAPWIATNSPTLQQCATPGFFFEVSPNQGVSAAMQALFQKAVAQARLTM